MRAIVLSGGGAKGSYEIGFFKAIRKLNIDYDIVTGSSVGALNGALLTQKDYFKALKLWYNLTFEKVIDEKVDLDDYNDILKVYIKNMFKGGMAITNLEKTVKKNINIKKIYKSNIDFGMITVKFPTLKPLKLTKKQIKPENFADFLIASASCFPAFKPKEINGQMYIDGGVYDNLPINLAIEMGADEVIAVDLDEIGIKRKVKYNADVTYISPKNDMGSFLIFSKKDARRGIRLGYNDTMKHFRKLDGNLYTFHLGDLKRNADKYKNKYYNELNDILDIENEALSRKILNIIILKKVIDKKTFFNVFNEVLEQLGYIFAIDDSYIYNTKKYNKLIISRFDKVTKENNKIEKNIKENRFKVLFNDKITIKYIYDLIEEKNSEKLQNMILFFPNEFLMALYIKIIKGR